MGQDSVRHTRDSEGSELSMVHAGGDRQGVTEPIREVRETRRETRRGWGARGEQEGNSMRVGVGDQEGNSMRVGRRGPGGTPSPRQDKPRYAPFRTVLTALVP